MNLSGNNTEAQAVIDVAQAAVAPKALEPGKVHVVALGRGEYRQIDLTGPEHTGVPARKSGTSIVRDVDSFVAYFEKHGDDDSEVYADVEQRTITAVLDAHSAEGARWGRHRLQLQLRHTPAWLAWTKVDNQLMPQKDFAEFIEDNLLDLVEPSAATMLELAESFEATTSAAFQSSQRLDNGQRRFSYTEEISAKAGHKGDIVIPATLRLGLRPFEGSEPYSVNARFKYSLAKEELKLGVKLDRPGDVLAAAFSDIRTLIDSDVPMAVLNGAPLR
ncbi:hypothetical protein GCM10011583_11510 [Streptomyces camponoticapitis]|uniref:DUF2303 family protein n=1 Tax=Streptomyces camponoticapitis TaxID=1616125 RepID=A0ABQ2DZD0_9ACTN|nr:DUF2303 family protein [Streptomyces camponoticapitis]GGJ81772.1 hypothetical protein GCM10011583_11510 [Streptomyces camponoticapitis]